jgi:hypothetical protein
MRRKIHAGQTGVTLPVFIQDSTRTDGGGLSGLVFNSSGLVAEYRRQGQSTWTAITLVAGTLGTWSSGGFVTDGSLAGAYELGLPDAEDASGAKWVVVRLYGATNLVPCLNDLELDAVDYQDAAALGLSRLDAAVSSRSTYAGADTSGTTMLLSRVPTFPTNFAAMAITSAGLVGMDGSRDVTVRNQDAVTAPTLDDCMLGSWTEAFAKEPTFNSTTWVKQKPDNSAAVRTYSLTTDGSGNVTARS